MPTPSPARLHPFEVVSNEPIAENIQSIVIRAPKLAAALAPGQFVNVAVPGNQSSLLRVPLSFARADAAEGTVEIWYAVVGDGTRRLAQMRSGDKSDLLGPGGRGWMPPEGCSSALLVAGGIGVPPVLCLARELAGRPGMRLNVVVGSAKASMLVGIEELLDLDCDVHVEVATDDGSAGHHGFCTDIAADLFTQGGFDYVATCGPEPMMRKVAQAAHDAGVFCEVSVERMMSCGFGACNTCNVETRHGMKGACMCGPVFDAEEVVW